MFDFITLGSFPIFIAELLSLGGIFYFVSKYFIPNFYSNINKIIEKENIDKANWQLYLFTFFAFSYIFLEYLGQDPWLLHIALAFVLVMFFKNINHPYVLKKWGDDSHYPIKIENDDLIKILKPLFKEKGKNRVSYEGKDYIIKADIVSERVASKKHTAKSKFMEGLFTLAIWSFFILIIIFVLKVDLEAPEIFITLLGFVIIYVFSPLYPDLISTFILAQDKIMNFGLFVEVETGGKKYFGSIETMNFFKVQLKDWYNDTIILIFHKLFFGSVITTFPNGRFIELTYVVSDIGQDKLLELISKWIDEKYINNNPFDIPKITTFAHDYGYGVKLRVNVKVKFLENYGGLNDDLQHLIVVNSRKEKIDLRTFDELNIHMKGGEKI